MFFFQNHLRNIKRLQLYTVYKEIITVAIATYK